MQPSRKQWAQDVVVSLALVFVGMMGTGRAGDNQGDVIREPDVWAYGLVVAAAVSLVLRRRFPGSVLVASGVAVVTYLAAGYPFGPIMLTIPVVGYTAGSQLRLRRAIVLAAGYYLAVLTVTLIRFSGEQEGEGWLASAAPAVASLAVFAAPVAIGAALRIRRESEAGVRAEQARRAVSEERLRMAQELHDSVGHGLAVIAMQAGVALHVLEGHPAKAREALEAIRDTSRESLDGLRAELQILRTPEHEEAPRRPGRGLAEAGVLIERIRAGGVEVRAEIDGVDRGGALPPDVDVAAYRILQESLTNVLRHAGASRADVRIRRHGDEILLDISDNGAGYRTSTVDVPTSSGTGIIGMRARAEALGGSLDAGPRPEGGFGVHARLPVSERESLADVPGSAT